ncbi:MAG: hypothetical protein GJU67_04890 [Ferrovum sp.]|jgi:hypothetical protein|nr:hypothetical protein [Ferrovum sp.]
MAISDLLARLKQEKVTPVTPSNLKGLPLEAPSLLKVTPVTQVTPQKTIVCKNSEKVGHEPAEDRPGNHWMIHLSDGRRIEVCQTPPQTRAWVLANWQALDATRLEDIPQIRE